MKVILSFVLVLFSIANSIPAHCNDPIKPGADRSDQYLPLLTDRQVACVVNKTSTAGEMHLVDFLIDNGVKVEKIFAPEHGFRGEAGAGATIKDGKDKRTGVPVLSLYGKTRKPTNAMLIGIDMVIFDLQDVGTRFYTYISTMHYVMEACAEADIPVMVLDRPNPNGFYIDGPVLKPKHRSFVGMHEIPVVHGCTVGEIAKMINGESWLADDLSCDLTVIPVLNYDHSMRYSLPVSPSPNLPNDRSINLYPSLCFFEGTRASIGRGTPFPFQVIGYPDQDWGNFTFTPVSTSGKAVDPKLKDQTCYGVNMQQGDELEEINLNLLIQFYSKWKHQEEFFIPYFETLAGTDQLRKQIKAGLSADEIRLTWQSELEEYKTMRKKYLLYPDFE